MKKLSLLFIAFLATAAVIAQVPNAINYQAVARNNAGAALATQTIKVRLTINRNAASLYCETRQVTTNALGLFNVQLGSSGALVTTGSFIGIDWSINPQPLMLKVELDISNSGTYTDMGSQTFATVLYSFTAQEAIDSKKIGGNAVAFTTPATGDVLKWNGTAWAAATATPAPQVLNFSGSIPGIPFGGSAAPWVAAGPGVTITVTAGQTITANMVAVVGHGNINPQPISFAVCYSAVATGSPLTPFFATSYTDATVSASPDKTTLAATGSIQLPAGTYKVWFGVKNKSSSVNLSGNDFVNGTVIIF